MHVSSTRTRRLDPGMRMCDLIGAAPELLLLMSRFGICAGCGESTVAQCCEAAGVDTPTFLAVARCTLGEAADTTGVSVRALLGYLRRAHEYYLGFMLPHIRRKLLQAMDCSRQNEVAFLMLNFYDKYRDEVRRHMQHEEKHVFAYVEGLLAGHRDGSYSISEFARSHTSIDKRLQELKNILIRYYTPTEEVDLFNSVLYDIYNCEADLRSHCEIEDTLFVPVVEALEEQLELSAETTSGSTAAEEETQPASRLSEREKEIVACVVKGMTNREIGERLFISVNTVQTHRKNICRKLDIHSTGGLTVYAIVNRLVQLDDVQLG